MLRIGPVIWIHTSRTGASSFSATFRQCDPHSHGIRACRIGGFPPFLEASDRTLILPPRRPRLQPRPTVFLCCLPFRVSCCSPLLSPSVWWCFGSALIGRASSLGCFF